MEEMTGDPNCVLVPDPTTFTVLPWTPKDRLDHLRNVLCERSAFPFDTRRIFRNALEPGQDRGLHATLRVSRSSGT